MNQNKRSIHKPYAEGMDKKAVYDEKQSAENVDKSYPFFAAH